MALTVPCSTRTVSFSVHYTSCDRLPQNESFLFVNAIGHNYFSPIFTKFGTRVAEVIFKANFACSRKRKYFAHMRGNCISVLLCLIHYVTSKNNTFNAIFIILGDQLNSVTIHNVAIFRLNLKQIVDYARERLPVLQGPT